MIEQRYSMGDSGPHFVAVRAIAVCSGIPCEDLAELLETVSYIPSQGPPAKPRCFDCHVTDLEHFYTSKDGGYDLCQACFDARQARGLAKQVEYPIPANGGAGGRNHR